MAFSVATRPTVAARASTRPATRQVRVQTAAMPEMRAAVASAALAASLLLSGGAMAGEVNVGALKVPTPEISNLPNPLDLSGPKNFNAQAQNVENKIDSSRQKLDNRAASVTSTLDNKAKNFTDKLKDLTKNPDPEATPIIQAFESTKAPGGTSAEKTATGPKPGEKFI